jgi:hypothetical protein
MSKIARWYGGDGGGARNPLVSLRNVAPQPLWGRCGAYGDLRYPPFMCYPPPMLEIDEPLPQDIPRRDLNDGYRLIGPAFVLRNPSEPGCTREDYEARVAARIDARSRGYTEFLARCRRHGDGAVIDVATGACLLCVHEATLLPVRTRYQAAGGTCWSDLCPEHGVFVARFNENCPSCQSPHAGARRQARAHSATTFISDCVVHGTVDHNVKTSLCLSCYTANGDRRSERGPGRPGDPRRMAAREAGEATYLAECEEHGEVAHHTVRGKCLTCYNTQGIKRPSTSTG